ncbi:DJ-1/PfpI family protein [Streptomyces avicenniae]|uniref:DJ-1/PfpI family protein n=1 Tax=Streptomyces avicenniae TaxID=500153 RepID=UPI00069ABE8B|nr:DJ-1/PfpI family protein [Streptomyces avicenniae]
MSDTQARSIGIFLFPGAEELEAVGPWEVLAHWTRNFPGDGWRAYCFSHDGAPVTCAKGLTIQPQRPAAGQPPPDVLLHPGGAGVTALVDDEAHLEWLRRQREAVPLLASVCTGALALAAAGLLRGRPATTHWSSLDLLVKLDPSVEIRPGERIVDDGDLLTSAGGVAGIDMSLHLVARLASPERAREVRRALQYDAEPGG